jgi:hypothetical protein
MAVEVLRQRDVAPEEGQDLSLAVRVEVRLLARRLDARVDEKHAEHVHDAVPRREHRRARRDEDAARDERADDAPLEHAMLLVLGDLQPPEDDDEDEEVVDAEALLDEERREVVLAGFTSELDRDPHAERDREADPRCAPVDRARSSLTVVAAVADEIDHQARRDHACEDEPRPEGDFEACLCLRHRGPPGARSRPGAQDVAS